MRSVLPRLLLALAITLSSTARATILPGMEGGRALYLGRVLAEAGSRGIPPALADAVAMVETGYRADATGSSGEIGMMQIMPATARQLGFRGPDAELFNPDTNIRLGVAYLARAWAMSGGNVCRALMKYRAGLGEEVMTPLSVRYCARATAWLAASGSHLAGALPMPEILAPPTRYDPYMIAVIPALAALARQARVTATPHELLASLHPHQREDRYAALNARFLSHQRHYGPFPKAEGSASDSDN